MDNVILEGPQSPKIMNMMLYPKPPISAQRTKGCVKVKILCLVSKVWFLKCDLEFIFQGRFQKYQIVVKFSSKA